MNRIDSAAVMGGGRFQSGAAPLYANINLWATLIGAIVCLPIGRLFDRAGLPV